MAAMLHSGISILGHMRENAFECPGAAYVLLQDWIPRFDRHQWQGVG